MRKRILQVAGATGVVLAVIFCVAFVQYILMHNLRILDDGQFYGSRQMSGAAMERAIDKFQLKTVINFRGEQKDDDWYDEEVAACENKGIAHYDFSWSKNSIPKPESLKRYLDLLDTMERPIMVHCQGGTHRTGMAAAAYELYRGESIAAAREQFGPAFNNAPIGQVVDLYEKSDLPFRQWVEEVYPGEYAKVEAAKKAAKEKEAAEK